MLPLRLPLRVVRFAPTLGPVVLLLPLCACTGDLNVNKGRIEMGVSPTSIDFGEVVNGIAKTLGVAVTNDGYGDLTFESVALDGLTSSDFAIVEYPSEGIGHGEEANLLVSYTPSGEGQDFGNVELLSNDADNPTFLLPLVGTGVQPEIDVDPETISFGIVPANQLSESQSVSIGAVGSGDLVIQSMLLNGDGAAYFSVAAPTEYVEPYTIANGFSLNVDVTFAPMDDLEQNAELYIYSNDPEQPLAIVRLFGNTADDPTTNTPPDVEIVDPNNGEYFMDNVAVPLRGHVVDPDDDVTTLLCGWYANGVGVAAAFPDSDGNMTSDALLPAGDTTVTLRCLDAAGDRGEDSVVLTVWKHDEPVQYVISGGATSFEFISVDDDVAFFLNGAPLYADSDNHPSNLAPIAFDASVGDELRIIVTDDNACDAYASAMQLHWGTGDAQPLSDTVCVSSCETHSCYDPSYAGPWPGAVLDETFIIAIP